MSRYGPPGGYPDQPEDARPGRWDQPPGGHQSGQPGGWEQPPPGRWEQHHGGGPQGQHGGWQQGHGGWEQGHGGWEQDRGDWDRGQAGGWEAPPPPPGHGHGPPPSPRDPHGRPADPWQREDDWSGHTQPQPAYREPQPTRPFHPPAPHHSAYPPGGVDEGTTWQDPPRSRRRTLGLVALVSVLVLLVAGGLAAALFWISGDEQDPAAGPGPQPTGTASPGAEEEAGEEGPQDRLGMSAVVAQPEDCLVNDGTDDAPEMRIVPCDTDEDTRVYRVLTRADEQVSGETAEEQDSSAHEICGDLDDYDFHYRFVGPTEDDSFVLCMAEE